MAISQEEVRFGVVPGLADLAKSLGSAFSRSKERDFQTQLASLRAGGQGRRAAASALPSTKKADQLTRRTKQNIIKTGEPGKAPKVRETPEGVPQIDPGTLSTLQAQQLGSFIPRGELEMEGEIDLLTAEERLTGLIAKNQRGEPLNDGESITLGQIQGVIGMSEELERLKDRASKKGEIGQPIVGGAEFMQAGLEDGSINPARANVSFTSPDGTELPSMNQLMQYAMNATDPANVAESQQTLTDLQNHPNPSPTDVARIDELQRVTAPAEFDEMHEIEAAFSQVAEVNAQFNEDVNILTQRASDVVGSIAGRQLNSEERSSLSSVIFDVDTALTNKFEQDTVGEARAQAQFRQDMGEHIKSGGSITTGVEALLGAQSGRAHRATMLAKVNPQLKSKDAQRTATVVAERARRQGLTPAQSEFVGQAFVAVQIPAEVISRMATMDDAEAELFMTQLENGAVDVGSGGGKLKLKESQVFALAQLFEANGLGRPPASQAAQQTVNTINREFSLSDFPENF